MLSEILRAVVAALPQKKRDQNRNDRGGGWRKKSAVTALGLRSNTSIQTTFSFGKTSGKNKKLPKVQEVPAVQHLPKMNVLAITEYWAYSTPT